MKGTCKSVVYLNLINIEIIRINSILSKYEKVNVLYNMKHSKLGIEKFTTKKW